jgi:hypothetical protein
MGTKAITSAVRVLTRAVQKLLRPIMGCSRWTPGIALRAKPISAQASISATLIREAGFQFLQRAGMRQHLGFCLRVGCQKAGSRTQRYPASAIRVISERSLSSLKSRKESSVGPVSGNAAQFRRRLIQFFFGHLNGMDGPEPVHFKCQVHRPDHHHRP